MRMQALKCIAQLDRVVSSKGGAALLCGHAGVGRKSALALVAYMHHMEVSHIAVALHMQQSAKQVFGLPQASRLFELVIKPYVDACAAKITHQHQLS